MVSQLASNPRGGGFFAAAVFFTLLSLTVVCARLYTRIHLVKSAGWDDALISLAWLLSAALTATLGQQADCGIGLHVEEVDPKNFLPFSKSFWACLWIFNASLALTKLSILMQYHRIFVTPWFTKACKATIVLASLVGAWTVLGSFFFCWPISNFWNELPARMAGTAAQCIDQFTELCVNSALNMFMDLLIILLPVPVLRTLKMPMRQKLALMGVFAVGAFVCVISGVRLYYVVKITGVADWSYIYIEPATWTCIECNTAIICACLPTLKAWLVRIIPRFDTSRTWLSQQRSNSYAPTSTRAGRMSVQKSGTGMYTQDEGFDDPGSQSYKKTAQITSVIRAVSNDGSAERVEMLTGDGGNTNGLRVGVQRSWSYGYEDSEKVEHRAVVEQV